jgi:hypothetical protein
VTPILVRPVREQLEHDRVIRLLQTRWRRKYLAAINVGAEQTTPIPQGDNLLYPDVLLASLTGSHKPEIVIEVETAESVNNLEALAQWARLARLRAAFHLYIPTGSVEAARRLCDVHSIAVAEIWTYHPVGDQMRFNLAFKAPAAPARRHAPEPRRAAAPARRPAEAAKRSPAPARQVPKPAAVKRAHPKKAAAKPVSRKPKR